MPLSNNLMEKQSISPITKIQTWLLLLSPILHMYQFISIVTVGEVALVLCMMLSILKKGGLPSFFRFDSDVLIILLYYGLSTFAGFIIMGESLFSSLKEYIVFSIYFVIVMILAKNLDFDYLAETYLKFGTFVACFMILQFAGYILAGIHIPGLIPGLTMNAGFMTDSYIVKHAARANGFFTEPAMAARYLGIPLLVSIHHLIKTNKFVDLRTILLLLGSLFALSGNAIVTILVGAVIYFVYLVKKRNLKSALFIAIFMIVLSVSFILLEDTPLFARLFARVDELSGDSEMKSGYIRVVRGYAAYLNFPFWAQIIGIGFGNYDNVIYSSLLALMTSKTDLIVSWVNGVQYFLIFGGVAGLFLYVFLIFKKARAAGSGLKKNIAILLLVYSFIAAIYAVPEWAVFMVFILAREQDESGKNRETTEK